MAQSPHESRLIAGQYAVDLARPMPAWGGGLECFVARDTRSAQEEVMALLVRRDAPPRAQALTSLAAMPIDGILTPLAHGPAMGPEGRLEWFVITHAPPGRPLGGPHAADPPWQEQDLLAFVLRPVAAALERLQARHVTHRGIRPDNLFRARPDEPVTLGCAWAAPAAALQPAIFEPPYAAMCLPGGRGEGSIGDDIYALGVTLLVLATGRLPMAGMDDAAIIRRKLELGSFAALAGEERLGPAIGDLIRGMLAEDPDHRPPPALLADPDAARARRVAARPPPRAQRPLDVGTVPAVNLRTLAFAIATQPEDGVRQLRGGAVDRWLRRSLGDSVIAAQLDELVRNRDAAVAADDAAADAVMAVRATALLDPLAPVGWRGLALFPDGLAGALAGATGEVERQLGEMVAAEAGAAWAGMRAERCDPVLLRMDAHQHRQMMRQRGMGGGIARLRYRLHPMLSCRSPLLRGALVVRLGDLLPALEAGAAAADEGLPIDAEVGAFMAARSETPLGRELQTMGEARDPAQAALVALRLLVWLQERQRVAALPNLAAWLAGRLAPLLEGWRNRRVRERMAAAMAAHAQSGALPRMLALLDNDDAKSRDAGDAAEAARLVAGIDGELRHLDAAATARAASAREVGHELVLGFGLTALTMSLIGTLLTM